MPLILKRAKLKDTAIGWFLEFLNTMPLSPLGLVADGVTAYTLEVPPSALNGIDPPLIHELALRTDLEGDLLADVEIRDPWGNRCLPRLLKSHRHGGNLLLHFESEGFFRLEAAETLGIRLLDRNEHRTAGDGTK
jgi:hypothetical protein